MSKISDIQKFAAWFAGEADKIAVRLDIPSSRYVSTRINGKIVGLSAIRDAYAWKSSWQDRENGKQHESQNWQSTSDSLTKLKLYLEGCVFGDASTEDQALSGCLEVIKWGGDRNSQQGATPFLTKLRDENRLLQYLRKMRLNFSLSESAIDRDFTDVECMNSMMTKVHSFCSIDGLPIYDSRVAASMGCLAEIYRREQLDNGVLPAHLQFPAVGGGGKRRDMLSAYPNGQVTPPISYSSSNKNRRWSKAKVTLGLILKAVLIEKPTLFANELNIQARMRSLEACLFMMGYNVNCFL